MNKDEKRELRCKRLMENKAYQTMNGLTRYMDRYYLDPDDMGTRQFRQLPVFIGSICFLNYLNVRPRLKLKIQLDPLRLFLRYCVLLIGYAQS